MKRCPECGFRANDHECPLCGVKMREDRGAVRTHVHTQQGERCVLPNQPKPVERKPQTQPVNETFTPQTNRRKREANVPNLFIIIVVLIVISTLRSCMN